MVTIPSASSSQDDPQKRYSTVVGASANVVNTVVGAGILGMPFALQQTGLMAGIILTILAAVVTAKSLRLMIQAGDRARTVSYEDLMRATFGRPGEIFVVASVFTYSYGCTLGYLLVIKDAFGIVLNCEEHDRAIVIVITALILFPLSAQPYMADLAKTSRLSVVMDCIFIILVAMNTPISETIESHGGWRHLLAQRTIMWVKWDTLFIGLGTISFAFICQQSGFIIAKSLRHPEDQWSTVTALSFSVAGALTLGCGIFGFLGYLDETQSDILNNFSTSSSTAFMARALKGTAMLFVFPMEAFVARHMLSVVVYKTDHLTVYGRYGWTLLLCGSALFLALKIDNFGEILAVSGCTCGSCLAYIGPGAAFIAAYGSEFLEMSETCFGRRGGLVGNHTERDPLRKQPVSNPVHFEVKGFASVTLWYVLGMPLWCYLASLGVRNQQLMAGDSTNQTEYGTISVDSSDENPSHFIGPSFWDFAFSVLLVLFGIVVLVGGLISIGVDSE